MTGYIIVNAELLPYWVISGWLALSNFGFMIGCELEKN